MRTQLQNFGGDDPIWSFVAQLRTERFTGSAHVGANPRLRLFVAAGRVYFAEREGDPALGTRLVNFGVLTATQLERGAVHVGDVVSLARLFHRDPTIDRDAVELTIEMATEKLLETVAQQPVATVELFPLRQHSSGIHLWTRDEPQPVYEPVAAVPAAAPAVDDVAVTQPSAEVAEPAFTPVEPAIHLAAAPVSVDDADTESTAVASEPDVPAEPVFQPASLSIPSLRPAPQAEEPTVVAEPEVIPEPTVVAEAELIAEPEIVADAEATPEPEVVAEPEIVADAEATPEPEVIAEPVATEPEVGGTPSLLAVLRAEEPRPEPRRESAASLLATLRDEPAPSDTITEVVPVVPAAAPEAAVAEAEVREPAPAPATDTPSGLTSLSALAPLAAAAPAPTPPQEIHEPFDSAPAAPPSAGLPHLAAAPTAVPRRAAAEDSLPQIPADANLPRLGNPGSAAVPATTAAPQPAEMAEVPDLATWTPAAQNMAAVQIWEMVDELTVPEAEPQLVPSGAGDDRKSRGWRKGRKG